MVSKALLLRELIDEKFGPLVEVEKERPETPEVFAARRRILLGDADEQIEDVQELVVKQ